MTEATKAYQAALTELEEAQRILGALRKRDPERAGAKVDVEVAMDRVRRFREAGVGSPLHEALVSRLDPALLSEIEADAQRGSDRGPLATTRGGSLFVHICEQDDRPAVTFVVPREVFARRRMTTTLASIQRKEKS